MFRITPAMRRRLVAFGPVRGVIVVTSVSVALSLAATALFVPDTDATRTVSLLIAAVIPLIVAPLVSGLGFGMLLDLDRALSELDRLASTDDLTQLLNRREFMAKSGLTMDALRAAGRPCAMILFDLDDFKAINDNAGHVAGDVVLQRTSALCRGVLRPGDLFARYGGDEFVVLLPNTDGARALALAESMNKVVHAVPATAGAVSHLRPTISLGVAISEKSRYEVSAMLAAADGALLAAKRGGRDRIHAVQL